MNAQKSLTLSGILGGKKIGRPQGVGLMEVIPLLEHYQDHQRRLFAIPSDSLELFSNCRFGSVVVKNRSKKQPLIVLTNTTWVTRFKAQDHALTKAGLLGGSARQTYNNAACVQSNQGGAIPRAVHDFQILPAALRRMSKETAEKSEYSKLWNDISNLNSEIGVPEPDAQLRLLFSHLDGELREFVAQFENLPRQIGALIVISGELQGVEIAPTPQYWESVWEPLIRFSYGPEAVLAATKLGPFKARASIENRPKLDCPNPSCIEDIQIALEDLRKREKNRIEKILESHLNTILCFESDAQAKGPLNENQTANYILASSFGKFVGQIVLDNDYVVYASLVNADCGMNIEAGSNR